MMARQQSRAGVGVGSKVCDARCEKRRCWHGGVYLFEGRGASWRQLNTRGEQKRRYQSHHVSINTNTNVGIGIRDLWVSLLYF